MLRRIRNADDVSGRPSSRSRLTVLGALVPALLLLALTIGIELRGVVSLPFVIVVLCVGGVTAGFALGLHLQHVLHLSGRRRT
jgi:hypothetical protein